MIMADWNKLWQEISDKTAQSGEREPLPAGADFRSAPHNLPADILRRTRLKLALIWIYLFAGLALLFWFWGQAELRLIVLIMLGFGLVNLWLVWPPYRQMKRRQLLMSEVSVEVLEFYHRSLQTMLTRENWIGALFAPFSAMLGFMWSFIEQEGTARRVFSDWRLLAVMLATAALIAPFAAWAVQWMNRKSFGAYLAHLKSSLDALRAV